LEKVITALQGHRVSRLTENSELFHCIIDAIQEKKGDKIISLDLKDIEEAVADYFVVCEAGSNIQINAIAQNIEERAARDCGERPYHVERGDTWTLVDFVNVVVHIFQHEQRVFYNLESLWADAHRAEH